VGWVVYRTDSQKTKKNKLQVQHKYTFPSQFRSGANCRALGLQDGRNQGCRCLGRWKPSRPAESHQRLSRSRIVRNVLELGIWDALHRHHPVPRPIRFVSACCNPVYGHRSHSVTTTLVNGQHPWMQYDCLRAPCRPMLRTCHGDMLLLRVRCTDQL
jgi:hypothetical protein